MTSNIQLQEGFWANDSAKGFVIIIKGNKMKYANMISLDYPDISNAGVFEMEIETGDFGPARKEIKEVTGADNYNVCIKWDKLKFDGVATPEGDKITLWGMANKVDVCFKMTSEQIQAKKDGRDHVEAPR